MIGKSSKIIEIFDTIKNVGSYNVNILINGPTGTGKELIAKALHSEYVRNSKSKKTKLPIITVNCAAIPDSLLESELFGYVKGAFTGAVGSKKGRIVEANGGTLFLDEIGDMPIHLQAKILRVIQERTVAPLGSSKEEEVDIRIIVATHRYLEKMVEDGEFREDLLFRLNVIKLKVPSLNERKDDIVLLSHHFLEKFNKKFNKNIEEISTEGLDLLEKNNWKGNIRELENVMEKAVLLCRDKILNSGNFDIRTSNDMNFSIFDSVPLNYENYKIYKSGIVNKLDKMYFNKLLKESDGNVTKASKLGDIERRQLYRLKDIK